MGGVATTMSISAPASDTTIPWFLRHAARSQERTIQDRRDSVGWQDQPLRWRVYFHKGLRAQNARERSGVGSFFEFHNSIRYLSDNVIPAFCCLFRPFTRGCFDLLSSVSIDQPTQGFLTTYDNILFSGAQSGRGFPSLAEASVLAAPRPLKTRWSSTCASVLAARRKAKSALDSPSSVDLLA